MHGPNFSNVDSIEKAMSLAESGVLEPLLLVPENFGGMDIVHNRVYVPMGFAALKEGHDANVILPLVQQGLIQHYTALPTYAGRSVVPVSILIEASDPRAVTYTLAIWGESLKGNHTHGAGKKPWWKFW